MFFILLLAGLSSATLGLTKGFAQDIGHFYVEDTSAADNGYMRLFGIGNDAYFRKWTGPKYKLATTAYVDSVLMVGGSYEPIITAGTTSQYWRGDKTWQTLNKSAVGLGNVNNTSDLSKPISTATQTALNAKAPINNPDFTGTVQMDGLSLNGTSNFAGGFVQMDGADGVDLPEILSFPESGNGDPDQVVKQTGGSAQWDWVDFTELTGAEDVVEADTASGRAVLKLPAYVADKIPDSSHFVIEADYMKVRHSGDDYFDTLIVGYDYYNLLRDSIELVLPAFDTSQFKAEHYFYITFYGSDDDDSLFVYDVDTVTYKFVYDDEGEKIDSVVINKITSILYFSDTVYFNSESSGVIYASTFMSSDHPRRPFQIPSENSPLYSFTLIWKPVESRYYLL